MDRKLRSRGINDKKPKSARSKDSKPGNSAKKKLKPRTSRKKHQKSVSNGNNNSKPETVANEDPKSGSSKNKDPKPETIRNSEPKPGPSRDVDSSNQPKKKCKVEDVEVRNGRVCMLSCKNINDLPNEMLLEIFRYLSVPERLKAEKVCCKWHKLVRSEVLWKCVKLSDVSESMFIEILASLPSCVIHFECDSKSGVLLLPISLPELMAQLHKQCPSIKILILRNMKFLKVHLKRCYVAFTLPHDFDGDLLTTAKNKLEEPASKIVESEFPKEETIGIQDVILPELKVLSLRRVMFNASHFFTHISATVLPKIAVLHLSYTQPPTSAAVSTVFSPFAHLEELCLGAWAIADDDIYVRHLNQLKILDLEHSCISFKAETALKEMCVCLEELYLCRTNIGVIRRTCDKVNFFPHLRSLCVRNTNVTQDSLEELLTECPSLKSINASGCKNISKKWYHGLREDLKEKILLDSNKVGPCNHFSKSKYC